MTVIAFPPKSEIEMHGWTPEERCQLDALYAACALRGEATDWAEARTETDIPQFFLFGHAPEFECVLSISRIDRTYVVEDGNGGEILVAQSLVELVDATAKMRFSRVRTALFAKLVLAWAAFREFVADKTEELAGEAVEVSEVLTHFIPQFAAFA